MYEDAIEKLRNIQEDNESFVKQIESGEIKAENADECRIKSLCQTYRWWAHCAAMAAWLLDNSNT